MFCGLRCVLIDLSVLCLVSARAVMRRFCSDVVFTALCASLRSSDGAAALHSSVLLIYIASY